MSAIDPYRPSLGASGPAVVDRLRQWMADDIADRVWRADPTVWPHAPASDVATRTGWLRLPETMVDEIPGILSLADQVRAEGTRHVVLLGMGGSSLAPDVLRRVFGHRPGFPQLLVLDSTHPRAISAVRSKIDPLRSLFIVSSKSGTTTEPNDFCRFFWEQVRDGGADPSGRFIAITDPGSPLEALAHQKSFRAVFPALPTVGGRYSALTPFGLVPAAMIGVDVARLLERARTMAAACGVEAPAPANPGLALGAALGELARRGRDKLTFYASEGVSAFPVWAEQLVAESTGKLGRGIVPVVDEPIVAPEMYGPDRLFVEIQGGGSIDAAISAHTAALEAAGHPVVRIEVPGPLDLGQEFFRWEFAVAIAGAILEIDPFDQPDVELAKELARRAMAGPPGSSTPSPAGDLDTADGPRLSASIGAWMRSCRAGDYVAVQAYLAPTEETTESLEALRRILLERLRVATTVGFGPRFLHSTGQLHKGGPNSGLFLQIVDDPAPDLEVPGAGYTFGRLLRAQALGDFQALTQKQRRILRVDVGSDTEGGLRRIAEAVLG
ncbi:MAG: glucose-6-phosphate isomerase [Thermoplasmata archaeon]